MKFPNRTKAVRQAMQVAGLGILLSILPVGWARGFGGQHGPAAHSAPAPRASAPRSAGSSQPNQQSRPQGAGQGRLPQAQYRQPNGYPVPSRVQPAFRTQPGTGYAAGNMQPRPAYNGSPYGMRPGAQNNAGHLPQWMAQHQGLPVNQQEHLLRQEPGFNRLNQGEQQRLVQQLHEVNQLPEAQRQRRLARNEAIEHLSPTERMQVNQAMRDRATLSPNRQAMVRGAFHDLRGVPPDQRETVLNSARYSSQFSPQERGILSNLLRVEPYEPPQP